MQLKLWEIVTQPYFLKSRQIFSSVQPVLLMSVHGVKKQHVAAANDAARTVRVNQN